MQMKRINRGKNIVEGGYCPVDGILAIRFRKSGEYRWGNVPEEKWVSLQRTPYPDRYFSQAIKGKFPMIQKPEKQDEPEQIQEPARRVRDDCAPKLFDEPRGRDMGQPERPERSGNASIQLGGRDDQSPRRGEMMEVFFPQDGMEFHDKDELGRPIHAYTLKGQRVPFSLTQILEKAGLSNPYDGVDPTVLANKAKLGTKVHEYTLWSDQGELDIDDLKPYPGYYNRVLGWQQFREDFKFMPDLTMCEVPIGVRLNGMLYAMKLDAYGCMGEGDKMTMVVVDKKCSCELEASYAIQTAGQAVAFKSHAESVNLPLKRGVLQLLDKPNGSGRLYKWKEHTDRMDEKIFVAALATTHWRFNNGLLKGM